MRAANKGQVPKVELTAEPGPAIQRAGTGARDRGRRITTHLEAHGANLRLRGVELMALLREEPDELTPR